MSFLEELKEDYEEASILTEDTKENIKLAIKEAVQEGSPSARVDLESASKLLHKKAIKYVQEELGLDTFKEDWFVGMFHVSGWC